MEDTTREGSTPSVWANGRDMISSGDSVLDAMTKPRVSRESDSVTKYVTGIDTSSPGATGPRSSERGRIGGIVLGIDVVASSPWLSAMRVSFNQ